MKYTDIEILKKLITFKSITPKGEECLEYIKNEILDPLGFATEIVFMHNAHFLYSELGNKGSNLCFSGHVDVVPPGNLEEWDTDPFEPVIKNGKIYGRGVCDMKGGIASFLAATIKQGKGFVNNGNTVSFLITTNEEHAGITVMKHALEYLKSKNKKIDHCLIAEPTSKQTLGDEFKVGRRGSFTVTIKSNGEQGHVAENNFSNPNTMLVNALQELKSTSLDDGYKEFPSSNLEVVNYHSDAGAFNVVPQSASATINIRFNPSQSPQKLENFIASVCKKHIANFELINIKSNPCYISKTNILKNKIIKIIKQEKNLNTIPNCSGGASDGAYIAQHCDDIIELGLLDATAHQVNENNAITSINELTSIFEKVLSDWHTI